MSEWHDESAWVQYDVATVRVHRWRGKVFVVKSWHGASIPTWMWKLRQRQRHARAHLRDYREAPHPMTGRAG